MNRDLLKKKVLIQKTDISYHKMKSTPSIHDNLPSKSIPNILDELKCSVYKTLTVYTTLHVSTCIGIWYNFFFLSFQDTHQYYESQSMQFSEAWVDLDVLNLTRPGTVKEHTMLSTSYRCAWQIRNHRYVENT